MKVNVGYAYGQLVRARQKNDAKRVAKWESVIAGMRDGSIAVGSRTPTNAPAWVTLEVATGGFATGAYAAAGGTVQDNMRFLESAEAEQMLDSGHYRIDVPEEGALLVTTWLRKRGEDARAAELVDTIAPWFGKLRFFPQRAAARVDVPDTVRLQDLGETVGQIESGRVQERFATMRDAELVWKPLRDRAFALWLETIEGEVPRVVDGRVTGGWPARVFPDGWRAWVHALVADCRGTNVAKTRRAYDVIRSVELLARVATHPNALDERALGGVRGEIARFVTAYGVPGDAAFAARRAHESAAVSAPLHADLRRILLARLHGEALEGGVELERVTHAVTQKEETRYSVPQGSRLPWYLIAKVARSWDAPLETLVERGVVPSAEVLARVVPQLTAQVRAQAMGDDAGRRLYAAIYAAFRRRRSLLLVNYAHQVQLSELPWVAAMEATRVEDTSHVRRARQVIARTSAVAIRAFPHTITPNKLVTELGALASAAKVELPLTEELAADIFMGGFTHKFVRSSEIAQQLLSPSLYRRYYALDDTPETTDAFAKLCTQRAGTGTRVAFNGKIIEQAQILTTHNLGVLFDRFALDDALAPHLRHLAERCFRFVVRQLRLRGGYHDMLVRTKNAAYAWRQMIFYLSFTPDPAGFSSWARTNVLARTDAAFRTRFEPAMRGLELAASGVHSSSKSFAANGGRVFTGWSCERHWLAPVVS
jgi:hypothetical protein